MYIHNKYIYIYTYSKLNETIKSQIKHYRISIYNNNNNNNNNNNTSKTHESAIRFCTINSYFTFSEPCRVIYLCNKSQSHPDIDQTAYMDV